MTDKTEAADMVDLIALRQEVDEAGRRRREFEYVNVFCRTPEELAEISATAARLDAACAVATGLYRAALAELEQAALRPTSTRT